MKSKVEYCVKCGEVTNQKLDTGNVYICKGCNNIASGSTTVLGNFLNDQLKRQLKEKVVNKK